MDEFEKRALDASKDKSNFTLDDGFAVKSINQAFVDGAKWARDEMQAEVDNLRVLVSNSSKASGDFYLENEGLTRELEQCKREKRNAFDHWQAARAECDGLKYELEQAHIDCDVTRNQRNKYRGELERANARHAYAQDEVDRLKAVIADDFFKRDRDHWHKECERLSLSAESYRSKLIDLAKFYAGDFDGKEGTIWRDDTFFSVDKFDNSISDRGDKARQALNEGETK